MNRTRVAMAAMVATLVWACGKSEAKRRSEIESCSAITLDAAGISNCLMAQYRWKPDAAGAAAKARQHELDSAAAHQRDSLWTLTSAQHRRDLASCMARAGDVSRCLTDNYAWDPGRATTAFDSVWHLDGRKHQQEVAACRKQGNANPSNCLMLYYKWDPKHAIAINDSLERARIRAMNR
ncbi:MAG TPA: hypothetical protein VLV45_07545 [Gemmatimonadales bacterium]|nr:hypothetical protein [Gemmatimonadales bacterium]